MRTHLSTLLGLALISACASRATPPQAPAAPVAQQQKKGLQIRHTSIYVDDQAKALRVYTDVLGFAKKDDVTNGPYRWLTVTAPGDVDGVELQLALDDNPAAKAYQEAMFQQDQPAIMFYTDDVKREYERINAHGVVEFTTPPKDVDYAIIAILKDTCGNLVQLTQLVR